MQNDYLFYILVPVYNVEKYIDKCIRSVINQTCNNWKMILVDDGSLDKSGRICDEYASKESRIKVIHKANGGLISARRKAIEYVISLSKTNETYVFFLDSDDALELETIETLNRIVQANDVDMVVYNYRRFKDNENLSTPKLSENGELIEDKSLLYKKVFCNYKYNSLCLKAVKVSLLENLDYSKYYSIVHAEDLLQSLDLYKRVKNALFIDAELYRYRMNPQSITHTVSYESYKVNSTVRKTVLSFLQSENVWNEHDYSEYMEYCKKLLKNEIRTIEGFKTQKKNKFKLFDEIVADDYYRTVLSYVKWSDHILNNLKKRKYKRVIFECYICRILSKIKTSIKTFEHKTAKIDSKTLK